MNFEVSPCLPRFFSRQLRKVDFHAVIPAPKVTLDLRIAVNVILHKSLQIYPGGGFYLPSLTAGNALSTPFYAHHHDFLFPLVSSGRPGLLHRIRLPLPSPPWGSFGCFPSPSSPSVRKTNRSFALTQASFAAANPVLAGRNKIDDIKCLKEGEFALVKESTSCGGLKSTTFITLSVKLIYTFAIICVSALPALITVFSLEICQILMT
jgi:hypothetical protein